MKNLKRDVMLNAWAKIKELHTAEIEVTPEIVSEIFRDAWKEEKEKAITESITLRDGKRYDLITESRLDNFLKYSKNGVHFAFYKKDGSIRFAHGTKNFKEYPEAEICLTGRGRSSTNLAFFDIELQEWRSMKAGIAEIFLLETKNKYRKVG